MSVMPDCDIGETVNSPVNIFKQAIPICELKTIESDDYRQSPLNRELVPNDITLIVDSLRELGINPVNVGQRLLTYYQQAGAPKTDGDLADLRENRFYQSYAALYGAVFDLTITALCLEKVKQGETLRQIGEGFRLLTGQPTNDYWNLPLSSRKMLQRNTLTKIQQFTEMNADHEEAKRVEEIGKKLDKNNKDQCESYLIQKQALEIKYLNKLIEN